MSNELFDKLEETAKKLVGKWYCKELDQHFDFSLISDFRESADLKITNTQTYNSQYTLSARPHFQKERTRGLYYISIGPYPNRTFDIMAITGNMLVLSEFSTSDNRVALTPLIYNRQKD